MCFEFSSCFGGGREDYGGERANHNEDGVRRRGRRGNNNRNGYYAGADHSTAYHNQPPAGVDEARHTAYHNQPPAGVDEAGHKAYHDGARKADNVGAGGRPGGYAAYTQYKADIEAPKLLGVPAWHNMAHLQEPAAMDYHHYPATTATTALGRY